MATTTNYGWTTPDDTSLVKDGAAAIRTLGTSVDTTTKNLNPSTTLGDIEFRSSTTSVNTRLGIGSSGQNLTVVAGVPSWAASATSVLTTTGDTLYASAANTLARLGIGSTGQVLTVTSGVPSWATPAGGATFAGALVYKSADQTLSNNSLTVLSFNSEVYDTNNFHDNSTNNSRFTIPSGKAGYYQIVGDVSYRSSTANNYAGQIQVNGNSLNFPAFGTSGGNFENHVPVQLVYYLSVGDYVELAGRQITGGSLAVAGGGINGTYFGLYYIGA